MSNTQSEQLEQLVLSDTELTETVATLTNTDTGSIRLLSKEFWEWVWIGVQIGLHYQSEHKR